MALTNYDPNITGVHTIQVTLMQFGYVGHITTKIGGNCKGKVILDYDFENETEFDTPYTKNDCFLRYIEDEDFFTATLKDSEGNELFIEADAEEMNRMIVAVEITDLEEE